MFNKKVKAFLCVMVVLICTLFAGCSQKEADLSEKNERIETDSQNNSENGKKDNTIQNEENGDSDSKKMNDEEKVDTATPGSARVMSYNCFTTTKAGVTYAAGKKGLERGMVLANVLNEQHPDSIGIQEITSEWKEYIEKNVLTYSYDCGITYAMLGFESDGKEPLQSGSTEYSPIIYRSDIYEVLASGGGWLSDTPDKPSKYSSVVDENGKTHPDMKFKRVYAYAVFNDKRTGETAYIHINTHFDHKSDDYINTRCSEIIAAVAVKMSEEYGCSVIVTGDFNSNERTEAYKYLADESNGMVDAKYLTEDRSEKGTFPGYWQDYSEASTTDPIDHIFVTASNTECIKHDVLSNKYFSDHSAVLCDLKFK